MMKVKIAMTICLPFILTHVVLARVWQEIKDIPFYIKCDVGMEWAYYKSVMRGEIER